MSDYENYRASDRIGALERQLTDCNREKHVLEAERDALLLTTERELAAIETQRDALLEACKTALYEYDEIINANLVSALKIHPFTLTPAQLRSAIALAEPKGEA